MTEKIEVRGVLFDNVNLDEAAAVVKNHMNSADGCMAVYTPNSEIVQNCIDTPELFGVINSAELIIPDGIGVVKAARIMGTPLKTRVAGIELGESVFEMAAEFGWKIYLLGGRPASDEKASVAEIAADKMSMKYPGVNFCGSRDGFFSKSGDENEQVKNDINQSGADIVVVCFGCPAQEKWIHANRADLPNVRLMLALGGSIDGYAGEVKRAPKLFIKLGLEWFYRLLCDPRRIGRMMSLPKFYFGTWRARLRK